MELTHEALVVQKNANQLINDLLYSLQEFDADYRTDGDGLADLLADTDIWDVSKWVDEEIMNDVKVQVQVLQRLFDWSEMIESNAHRNDMATRNVERQLPDLEGDARRKVLDELIKSNK
jgi:hypothetical protein|tara:strand:+ start:336 stop:692 length:357 start_codon:yes stop_codon:yes gene_type:complete